jgi:hypothetical protein
VLARRYARIVTPEELANLAHLRRGDLSVTEVCMAVGCTSLGSFGARETRGTVAP